MFDLSKALFIVEDIKPKTNKHEDGHQKSSWVKVRGTIPVELCNALWRQDDSTMESLKAALWRPDGMKPSHKSIRMAFPLELDNMIIAITPDKATGAKPVFQCQDGNLSNFSAVIADNHSMELTFRMTFNVTQKESGDLHGQLAERIQLSVTHDDDAIEQQNGLDLD